MSIYIRTTTASKENQDSRINAMITRLAAVLSKQQNHTLPPIAPSLEVNFLLPGKEEKPNFQGMIMRGYTTEDPTLHFECSVPERFIEAQNTYAYIEAVLDDVLDNAAEYFNESNIVFDKPAWANYLHQVKQQIA